MPLDGVVERRPIDIANTGGGPWVCAQGRGETLHAIVAAGAGFLVAVLWFDLMFDVQARRGGAEVPAQALASISAYYRRVTTEARPMPRLVALVMLVVLGATVAEIVRGGEGRSIGWASLACAGAAISLAMSRTVRNAVRLGQAQDAPDARSRLARSILRDHQFCLAAMVLVLGLQLMAAFGA
jgi:hypothetical protein